MGARRTTGQTSTDGSRPCGCSVKDVMRLLGKAHVMGILYQFHEQPGPKRFVHLQEALDMSPNTLSDRLRDLVGAGLLSRTAYNEIPPRVDYDITPKARELQTIFNELCDWAERNNLEPIPATEPVKVPA